MKGSPQTKLKSKAPSLDKEKLASPGVPRGGETMVTGQCDNYITSACNWRKV